MPAALILSTPKPELWAFSFFVWILLVNREVFPLAEATYKKPSSIPSEPSRSSSSDSFKHSLSLFELLPFFFVIFILVVVLFFLLTILSSSDSYYSSPSLFSTSPRDTAIKSTPSPPASSSAEEISNRADCLEFLSFLNWVLNFCPLSLLAPLFSSTFPIFSNKLLRSNSLYYSGD